MSADNNTEQWFFDNLKLVQQAGELHRRREFRRDV